RRLTFNISLGERDVEISLGRFGFNGAIEPRLGFRILLLLEVVLRNESISLQRRELHRIDFVSFLEILHSFSVAADLIKDGCRIALRVKVFWVALGFLDGLSNLPHHCLLAARSGSGSRRGRSNPRSGCCAFPVDLLREIEGHSKTNGQPDQTNKILIL